MLVCVCVCARLSVRAHVDVYVLISVIVQVCVTVSASVHVDAYALISFRLNGRAYMCGASMSMCMCACQEFCMAFLFYTLSGMRKFWIGGGQPHSVPVQLPGVGGSFNVIGTTTLLSDCD